MDDNEFRKFRKEALKYFTRGGHFFRRPDFSRPVQRVVDEAALKQRILKELYNNNEHKGRESTFIYIIDQYYWDGLYKEIKQYMKTYREC